MSYVGITCGLADLLLSLRHVQGRFLQVFRGLIAHFLLAPNISSCGRTTVYLSWLLPGLGN